MRLIGLAVVLIVTLILTPFLGQAQPQTGKVWRIAWLGDGTRAAREWNTLTPLREGLRELGYIEDKNIVIDARWSEGSEEQLRRDAADFVRRGVDVIITHGGLGAIVAKKATPTIPIVVATASDFVAAGLVTSLAHPGGNLTGTNDAAVEITGKQVELLAQMVPRLRRVALFWDETNPTVKRLAHDLGAEARRLNVAVISVPLARLEDLQAPVDRAVRERAQAIIVALGGWTLTNRARIVRASLSRKLPVTSASRLFADDGALASYGPDLPAVYKRAAMFVDKILRGTPPGEIPVEQPTKYELVINLKTAKALGLTIPQSILVRADEVIQ
jgi:putative tryptophan/tyrosine transport system substrate-binding protein